MYFIQYVYEIVGDYSVAEEIGTVILSDLSDNMEEIIREISNKTSHNVLSINEIQPFKNSYIWKHNENVLENEAAQI